jgi:hypothetical protein
MIEENGHLAHKYELDAGDEVILPIIKEISSPKKIMRNYGT